MNHAPGNSGQIFMDNRSIYRLIHSIAIIQIIQNKKRYTKWLLMDL